MSKMAVFFSSFLASVLLLANMVSAAVYYDQQLQTIGGEAFTLELASLVASDGTDGILTISGMGDYFGKPNATDDTSERLDVLVDGIFEISNISKSDVTILGGDNIKDDILWESTWVIPASVLQTITADNQAIIDVDLDPGVRLIDGAYVEVSLEYSTTGSTSNPAVPIPASVLLLGSALFGMVGLRRKMLA